MGTSSSKSTIKNAFLKIKHGYLGLSGIIPNDKSLRLILKLFPMYKQKIKTLDISNNDITDINIVCALVIENSITCLDICDTGLGPRCDKLCRILSEKENKLNDLQMTSCGLNDSVCKNLAKLLTTDRTIIICLVLFVSTRTIAYLI